MKKKSSFGALLSFALKNTYAVGISWIPVALAFGLIVRQSGFPFYWAGLSGILCPAGSLQMMLFSLTMSHAAWYTMLITSLALSFRHMFYGLSFLQRFRPYGKARFYLIYMLCDEAYSVFCSMEVPDTLDEKKAHVAVAVVLQTYWVVLSMLFALLGSVIPFDLTGVDFALTALFFVILLEMLLTGDTKLPAVCALSCGLVCLVLFGADQFLIPALLLVCTVLVLLKKPITANAKEGHSHG